MRRGHATCSFLSLKVQGHGNVHEHFSCMERQRDILLFVAHVKLNENSIRMIGKDSSLFQCVCGASLSVPDDKVGTCSMNVIVCLAL